MDLMADILVNWLERGRLGRLVSCNSTSPGKYEIAVRQASDFAA
jgi:hypothetical protein